jgi:uncharacterized repeat protein (TIGR01451 family)/CSLREA domain-containing protein
MRIRKLFTAFILGLGLTLALVWLLGGRNLLPTAHAASFTVDVTYDENDGSCTDGDCSLRDAIIIANGNGEADVITLGAGTYELSITGTLENAAATGDLDVTAPLTITGLGPAQTIIDANGIDRVFELRSSAGTVVISGVTVFNGNVTGGSGGGIYCDNADLHLVNTAVASNATSGYGGGVFVTGGSQLTLVGGQIVSNTGKRGGGLRVYSPGSAFTQTGDSLIAYNVVSGTGYDGSGGGVYVSNSARAALAGARILSNTAGGYGGGVFAGAGSVVTLDGGQIISNAAFYGGGVSVDSSGTAFTQTGDSLIAYNAAVYGGGVYARQWGRATFVGGRILSNTASNNGGGLRLDASYVALIDAQVNANSAGSNGGGAYLNQASVTLDGGQIAGNTAKRGGGMYISNASTILTQTGASIIAYNVVTGTGTDGWGGGLYISAGRATLRGGQIAGNVASENGGGVYASDSGHLMLQEGRVLGNTAGDGGGLYNNGGTLTLVNTTVSGNAATTNYGGLRNNSGTSVLTFTTVASNTATGGIGGIHGGGIAVWLQNTIVAHNEPVNCSGVLTSTGHNLDSGTTCGFSATGDITDTDPLIGPLDADGGHPLLPGSPAIDKGICLPGITTDQRGVSRPYGSACDIGAYEYPVTIPLEKVTISGPGATAVGVSAKFVATVGPVTATQPIAYVWQATGMSPETHADGGISDTVSFAWSTLGSKTVTVTASNITNTVQATRTIEIVVLPVLVVAKDGPAEAVEGHPITYTLTVTNVGSAAADSLVITDALPAGAYLMQVLDGGQLVGGDVVSWSLPSLGVGADVSVRFVVAAAQTITNADYRASAAGGHSGTGDVPVVTVVTPSSIRYVAPGGTDGGNTCGYSTLPCATLQHAVDVADPGNEIRVAAGVYTGTRQVLDGRTGYTYTQVVFITQALTLRGGYNAADWSAAPDPTANPTVLDAERSGRGVSIVGVFGDQPAVTVDGFTVTGGDYTGLHNASDSTYDQGGGVYGRLCALTLRNSVITDNIAGQGPNSQGGGICLVDPDASPGTRIENTAVISNSALGGVAKGGGMYVLDPDEPMTITHSTFRNNRASSSDGGLGVVTMRNVLSIIETDFISNTVRSGGNGGARVYFQSGGDLWMDRVRFQNNWADVDATLRLDGWGTAPRARLTNVLFSGNHITATTNHNALVCVDNRATRMDVSLAHVTAADNHVPTFLFAWQHPDTAMTATLTNTLLVSFPNAFVATENANGELLIRHTNTLTDDVITLHHTTSGTPTLQAIDPLAGDPMLDDTYHLQEGSDAIDAGVDVAGLVGADHDLDGQVRPWGLAPDIGADEFVLVAPESASISGPTEGIVGESYTFTATFTPAIAEPPISYTWSPEPDGGQGADVATYSWGAPGAKTITVTVENAYGAAPPATHDIFIEDYRIYLPVAIRNA